MPAFRGPDGKVLYVPDEEASRYRVSSDYQEIDRDTAGAAQSQIAPTETGGALGTIGAGASSFLSGATLGLSDLAFKGMLDQGSYKRLAADREAHPFVSGAGQIAGTLVGGPTPAGALNEATAAASAGRGVAARIAADAAAGSVYNAGAYLSDSALSDREMSAEGLRAALGAGFEFGAAGGAAALGIEKGTIAARRMFSRLSDGTERVATEAEQAWRAKHQTTLDVNDAAADVARAKLAEANLARQQAQLAQQRAAAGVADAHLPQPGGPFEAPAGVAGAGEAASGAPATAPGIPAPSPPLDEQIAGILNDRAHVGLQPGVADPRAAALDQQAAELMAQRAGGDVTQVTGPSFRPGDPGFRFDYSTKGSGNALDLLGEQPGVVTRGPAELGRVPGSLPNEAELTAALREHDGARKEFLDALAKIDAHQPDLERMLAGADQSDLESLLSRVDPAERMRQLEPLAQRGNDAAEREFQILRGAGGLDVQRPPVALGEFGAPGARGFKSQDELARLAAGTGREDGAVASREDVTGAGGPRALRGGAKGTPVEQPATAVGKRPDTGAGPDLPAGFDVHGSTEAGPVFDRDPAIRSGIPEYRDLSRETYRKNGYVVRPSELLDRELRGIQSGEDMVADARTAKVRGAWSKGESVPPLEIDVDPKGVYFAADGNHRLLAAAAEGDRPVLARFRPVEAEVGNMDRIGSDLERALGRQAAPATDTLTGQLRGMQAKLGAGENLAEMGRAPGAAARAEQLLRHPETADRFLARAEAAAQRQLGDATGAARHPLSVRSLEQAHESALEREATAATPAERAAAAQDAQVIERQLTAVGARPGAVEDVAAIAPVVTRYERAGARLAEALGNEAPPAAKESAQAFRAAEDAADQRVLHRATRAIDDHVEGVRSGKRGPAERTVVDKAPPVDGRPAISAAEWNDRRVKQGLGDALAPPTGGAATNPRIAAAEAAKLRADAGLAHARAAETEAKIGATTAKRTAAEYRAAAKAERPTAAAPAEQSMAGAIFTTIAAAGELGIPGIPHPKDIPVIGPLLSLWTKYRIAKAMVGRFSGRVAATGDARAAAFAARAKDKVAAAVDRTLGLAAEVAPKARGPIVATAAVLGHRLIDDGEPDAPKGANAQEIAAVRIREIAAAASHPDLVVSMVRKQLGGVTDPDLIAAAEQVLQRQFQYLAGVMPKLPPPNPYAKTQFVPSPAAAADLADRIGVMHDPASAFDNPTPAKADALANFYSRLFAAAQQRLAERAAELKEPMTNRQQLIASLIFRVPVATSMEPGRLAVLQSAHVALRTAMQPTPQPGAPPTPAVAQPTNLNPMYQTSADRRAARM